MLKVLISDNLSNAARSVFVSHGVEVDIKTNLSKEEMVDIIGEYDGLAVRSATRVTPKVLECAKRLRVIGRAGIGVDNIDVAEATRRGIIVMNTPFGNSITTAEHAIAMMFSLARQIPEANSSTHAGKWEKNRFVGMELTGKTLGIVGCGNIGAIVAERALGLKMRVLAYDPFLSLERARDLGIEKVDLDTLLSSVDIVTLHTPLTERTRNIIDAAAVEKMKVGIYIVNCARGGLIVEEDLKAAIESGHVAGAALDVFSTEPATNNPLFGMEQVICTPHLGASTTEAQEKVALQVAAQMADYLTTGAVTNALNTPSVTAEEAPLLKPFINVAELLGSFAGQITESGIEEITIEYEGQIAELNLKALTAATIAGVMRPLLADINMINAPSVAKERGVQITEVTREQRGVYESYIRLSLRTERQTRSVAGTVFSDGKPRIIKIGEVNLEAELISHMLYIVNRDRPGFIGALGALLGGAEVNIATFALGRETVGADATTLVGVDGEVSDDVINKIRALDHVVQAQRLVF
ncbi:MAG: phosphoglycerate dehydrogenase [Parvularculales bacterium]